MEGSSISSPVSTGGPSEVPVVLSASEVGNPSKQWTLTLHPTHLALAELPDPQPYIILREELMRTAILMEGIKVFVIDKPRKLNLKLTPEAVNTMAEWIGKPLLAGFYLKRRYAWMLPIAIMILVGSLPVGGDSAAGTPGLPFDPVSFVLGITLIGAWTFAKWRPHPVLFLVDSIWLLTMAGQLLYGIIHGRSLGWLVAVVVFGSLIVSGVKHFLRFKKTPITLA